ncbi:unnamed protein product [Phytophthora fragariaefolia]|uniref:Unnamed protein product n=1 Tax=Phytophthora fragariaefolia TaxID=1490495 RepID=A0A9W6WXI3_9STRA|nr:unnamed protein product [Phytophthora fragariaefolia]
MNNEGSAQMKWCERHINSRLPPLVLRRPSKRKPHCSQQGPHVATNPASFSTRPTPLSSESAGRRDNDALPQLQVNESGNREAYGTIGPSARQLYKIEIVIGSSNFKVFSISTSVSSMTEYTADVYVASHPTPRIGSSPGYCVELIYDVGVRYSIGIRHWLQSSGGSVGRGRVGRGAGDDVDGVGDGRGRGSRGRVGGGAAQVAALAGDMRVPERRIRPRWTSQIWAVAARVAVSMVAGWLEEGDETSYGDTRRYGTDRKSWYRDAGELER